MAARALSLLVAKLQQFWHCRPTSVNDRFGALHHQPIVSKVSGRYTRVGCSCGLTFWERAR